MNWYVPYPGKAPDPGPVTVGNMIPALFYSTSTTIEVLLLAHVT